MTVFSCLASLLVSAYVVGFVRSSGDLGGYEERSSYRCPAEGWINSGDTCYHVPNRLARWHQVGSVCRSYVEKAVFATLDDRSDMAALAAAAVVHSAPTVWVKGSNTKGAKGFVWHDGAKGTPIDSRMTPWSRGFPEDRSNQFVYMKVDLENRKAADLAHSAGNIERPVACMMPAQLVVEAQSTVHRSAGTVVRRRTRLRLDLTRPRRRKNPFPEAAFSQRGSAVARSRYDTAAGDQLEESLPDSQQSQEVAERVNDKAAGDPASSCAKSLNDITATGTILFFTIILNS